jgi:membrane protein
MSGTLGAEFRGFILAAPTSMRPRQLYSLGKDSVQAWMDDYAPSMGAALAYYTLFSLAPVLLIVIAVAGMVFGVEAARGEIVGQLQGLIGTEGATAVQGLLKSASHTGTNLMASAISIITLLVGATTVFSELQSDLDRIWRAPAVKQKSGLWALLRARLLTFGMVLAVGFLLLVSLVISAGLAALAKWGGSYFVGRDVLMQVLNVVVSFGIITMLFALIYKILPRVQINWSDVWIGAGVTALLFTLGKLGIGLYLGMSSVTSGFGAAGSIVVLLVWVYFSAQIFLLGAEFTWVFAHRHGSRAKAGVRQPAAPAVPTRSEDAAAEPPATERPATPPPSRQLPAWQPQPTRVARAVSGGRMAAAWLVGITLGALVRYARRRAHG